MSDPLVMHLFAYGTLMSTVGCERGWQERRLMLARARLVGIGSISGRLYDVGLYPAAVPSPRVRSRIYGEIWRIPKTCDDILSCLDRYEGCAPENEFPSVYRRDVVTIVGSSGRRVLSWMYTWIGDVDRLAEVRGGRWEPPRDATGLPDVIRRSGEDDCRLPEAA